jgi:hypothetical protein
VFLVLLGLAMAAWAGCGSDSRTEDQTPATPERADEPAAAPAEAERATVHRFCVESLETTVRCADDPAYWDVMATLYLASTGDEGAAPEARQLWIDAMRGMLLGLAQDGELAKNCDATLAHQRWPTAAQMARVNEAGSRSCTEFANAYGWMMFGEGVFH